MRSGKLKYLPLCSLGPSLNIGMTARTASSKTSRLFSMVMSNGSSSVIEALSPMPNSARPLDSRSRQATRSAMWAGWLVVSCRMPWPSRICLVRWLAAARNEAGDGRVGVFLEEVVLDLPGVVVAELVGQLELVERILVEPVLVALLPGPRQLQLVEDAELHALFLPGICPPKHARKWWGCKGAAAPPFHCSRRGLIVPRPAPGGKSMPPGKGKSCCRT